MIIVRPTCFFHPRHRLGHHPPTSERQASSLPSSSPFSSFNLICPSSPYSGSSLSPSAFIQRSQHREGDMLPLALSGKESAMCTNLNRQKISCVSWGSAALAEGQEFPPQLRCSWRSDLCRNPRGDADLARFIESVKSFSFTGSRISKKAHLPKTICFHRQNGPRGAKTSLLLVCQRGAGGLRRPPLVHAFFAHTDPHTTPMAAAGCAQHCRLTKTCENNRNTNSNGAKPRAPPEAPLLLALRLL